MKTPPPLPYGLRILVVDDEEDVVRLVSYDLRRAFADSVVDVAGTVAEAEVKLRVSVDECQTYDVVILDFMLPPDAPGQNPEPDHSLGYLVRDCSIQSLIVHVTAYQDDPRFRSFLRYKDASSDVGRLCVAKGEGWTKQLIEAIHHNVAPYRLRLQFDSLFRRQRDPSLRQGTPRGWTAGSSERRRSLEIAALCAEASRHWEFLSPALVRDIEHVLGHAVDQKGNHFVGVVRPEADEHGDQEEDLTL
jgi:CheY-like chemotaxis protein